MKPGSDSVKKPDDDKQGIDFIKAVQIGGGAALVLFVIWLILRYVLHLSNYRPWILIAR